MNKLLERLKNVEVEWKRLGEVIKIITAPAKIKRNDYLKEGKIPIIDQGLEFVSGYTNNNLAMLQKDKYIIFGDHSEHIKFVDFAFAQGADGLKILKTINDEPKYIYYAFVNFYRKTLNYKRHWSIAKETLIPIPPLQIQKEIVQILDNFTELTTELAAELRARKKQYNYYLNKLLTFSDDEAQWKKLGEVAKYEQPTKYIVKSTNYNDDYDIPVLTAGKTFILGYTNEKDGIYKASKNPVIIFDDFTTANKWVDFDFKVKSSAMKLITAVDENICLLKYIYYWLNTLPNELIDGDHKRQWINNYSNKKIPIPPLKKQKEIVEILDKFDTLTNSISEGLPKEIELRQKQYEYYRNLLLDFKK